MSLSEIDWLPKPSAGGQGVGFVAYPDAETPVGVAALGQLVRYADLAESGILDSHLDRGLLDFRRRPSYKDRSRQRLAAAPSKAISTREFLKAATSNLNSQLRFGGFNHHT